MINLGFFLRFFVNRAPGKFKPGVKGWWSDGWWEWGIEWQWGESLTEFSRLARVWTLWVHFSPWNVVCACSVMQWSVGFVRVPCGFSYAPMSCVVAWTSKVSTSSSTTTSRTATMFTFTASVTVHVLFIFSVKAITRF